MFCVLSGLVGILYLGFDPLVRSIVLKNLVLSNTSSTFHIWEDPPISPHLKAYPLTIGFVNYYVYPCVLLLL